MTGPLQFYRQHCTGLECVITMTVTMQDGELLSNERLPETWAGVTSAEVSSIIDDETIGPYRLSHAPKGPLGLAMLFTAVADCEARFKRRWDETHGCPSCGESHPCSVNKNCPDCRGEGAPI